MFLCRACLHCDARLPERIINQTAVWPNFSDSDKLTGHSILLNWVNGLKEIQLGFFDKDLFIAFSSTKKTTKKREKEKNKQKKNNLSVQQQCMYIANKQSPEDT